MLRRFAKFWASWKRSWAWKRRGELDKADQLILRVLRDDARISNTDLAKKLDLSEATVRRRIAGLVESGAIRRFTVEVDDPEQTSAIMWVSVNPSIPTGQVSGKIKDVSGVETVYETAGQFDVAVIIKGANIVEVNKSVEGIRRLAGVISTNTMMVLRTIQP
ncbi:MAG: Lrp/AsnC family transcriptional regulator [Thaumarchaeota archaeon]|nr:MAG: Lrp/AsnC family transcriptional regulator [Nitrososphaerota archaeon]